MAPRISEDTSQRPLLTAAESEVMQLLWSSAAGLTVRQVVEALPRKVAYTTALTTLQILERKGYVEHRPHPNGGRAHVYLATEPAQVTRKTHARDLVDRLFGGDARELLVGLLQDERLEASELRELKALVDAQLDANEQPKASKKKGKK